MRELVLEVGVNLEPGQNLELTAYVEHAPFVRALVRAAYERGARYVDVWYEDEQVRRAMVEGAADDVIGWTPPWVLTRLHAFDERGAMLLVRGHPDPHLFDDVDGERLARARRTEETKLAFKQIDERLVNWTIVGFPTEGWAREVFGEPDVERLWEAIAHTIRLDEPDPVAAWQEHIDRLVERAQLLNERHFDALRFRGPGTDLMVGLHERATWQSAHETTVWGRQHVPNLPTEEVFTTPDARRTEGTVRSTRPLLTEGALVEGLELRFQGGRVVGVEAESGAEVVRGQVASDAGSATLGEVALVDGSSRVGRARHRLLRHALRRERDVSHRVRRGLHRTRGRGRGGQDEEELTATRSLPVRAPRGLHDRRPRGRGRRRSSRAARVCPSSATTPGSSPEPIGQVAVARPGRAGSQTLKRMFRTSPSSTS